jgi:anti-sigma factor RsiW
MTCRDVLSLLNPYADGELDLVRQIEIEKHLTECAECAKQEEHLRSLRVVLASPSLYYRAPTALHSRVQLSAPTVRFKRRRSWARQAAIAAGVLLLLGTGAAMGVLWSRTGASADDRLADWVVASHVRSLQVEHLNDVASSDQHTVKPWFRGKVNFSPQVPDLTPQGFALSGGRLDYLADRPVAALVYHRRAHVINLFTWPAADDEDKAVRGFSRQGFHIRQWQRSGMNYWAISDLNDQELDEFVRLFQ